MIAARFCSNSTGDLRPCRAVPLPQGLRMYVWRARNKFPAGVLVPDFSESIVRSVCMENEYEADDDDDGNDEGSTRGVPSGQGLGRAACLVSCHQPLATPAFVRGRGQPWLAQRHTQKERESLVPGLTWGPAEWSLYVLGNPAAPARLLAKILLYRTVHGAMSDPFNRSSISSPRFGSNSRALTR